MYRLPLYGHVGAIYTGKQQGETSAIVSWLLFTYGLHCGKVIRGKQGTAARTDLRGLDDLVVFERIEVVLDVHRGRLLDHTRAKEGVRGALRRDVLRLRLLPVRRRG